MRPIRRHAFAKINVTLRVLGTRPDGLHDLRTVFQSVALHDTMVFEHVPGPFQLVCSDPECPSDDTNLVWRAADALWRHARRRGRFRDLRVRITKRIPLQSGLGGGSSDAAAALQTFAELWDLRLACDRIRDLAASLGADVAYFLDGGTALGLERGDLLFPLADLPSMWAVLVVPTFGVSTKDAYAWWDRARKIGPAAKRRQPERTALELPVSELVNDLERPVAAKHPEIGQIVRALQRSGAEHAAMSGSGSAVFGLFRRRAAAAAAAAHAGKTGRRVIITRTLGRGEYAIRGN